MSLTALRYRRDGMLSDESAVETDGFMSKVSTWAADKGWDIAGEAIACLAYPSTKEKINCGIDMLKEACDAGTDSTACELVEIGGKIVNNLVNKSDASFSSGEKTDAELSSELKSNQDVTKKALEQVLAEFQTIDCSDLSKEQRQHLVTELTKYEAEFIKYMMLPQFYEVISKLRCDVVKELSCDGPDANGMTVFTSEECKKPFMEVWGKPLAVGAVVGTGTGFAWHKLAKGSVTVSLLVGAVAGGGTTYFLKIKGDKKDAKA